MSRTNGQGWSRVSRMPEQIAAIEAALPGIKVATLRLECRRHGDEPDLLSVDFTISGPVDVLIGCGFATQEMVDALPPCGVRSFACDYRLSRTMRGLRVNGYWDEAWDHWGKPGRRHPQAEQIWNWMAAAVAGAVWRPRSEAA